MKCPNCGKDTTYSLSETADDYQDGYVECDYCDKTIATFTLVVLMKDVLC
jgi:DNA-directed RNA polymerase subunit RPC12/RpoP